MIGITDLVVPVSAANFRAQMVGALKTLGIPADQWKPGGVASSMLTVIANTLANLSIQLSTIVSGFFLPTATGDNLTLLAFYVYGVTRPTATFATGQVVLTNAQGGSFTGPSYAAGQVTFLATNGFTYTNTQDLNLGPVNTPTATQTVAIECTALGTQGNAAPNTVTGFQTTLLGVSVTNPSSVVGQDAMADADLRTLCLAKLGALSVRGPRTAYQYAATIATNPITGGRVNINRVSVSEGSHIGVVTVIIAAPSGAPDPNDLAAVQTSVEQNARPAGVTANVIAAAVVPVTSSITVYCILPSGTSIPDATSAVDAAIATYISTFPIGGIEAADDVSTDFTGLFASGIYGAAAAAITKLGGTYVSARGANDTALTSTQVAADDTSVVVRIAA